MRILAIETSCDETAVSVLECTGNPDAPVCSVLGTGLYSQASTHARYGGVYPSLAKREHQKNLVPMLEIALGESGLRTEDHISSTKKTEGFQAVKDILERESTLSEETRSYLSRHPDNPGIDAISVTQGPGLEPALWVGLNFAKALSVAWQVPLVPVNHMEGHVVSVLYRSGATTDTGEAKTVALPAVALLVSGGHTELQRVSGWGHYELLGQTRDDAVGEAFDKVARMMDLPYPGGPEISRLAEEARSEGITPLFTLPRPMIHESHLDFSFVFS
jgi:N6-L-threonylcarbamoyladenine synthase